MIGSTANITWNSVDGDERQDIDFYKVEVYRFKLNKLLYLTYVMEEQVQFILPHTASELVVYVTAINNCQPLRGDPTSQKFSYPGKSSRHCSFQNVASMSDLQVVVGCL